jgi:FkbM family methyltransferase
MSSEAAAPAPVRVPGFTPFELFLHEREDRYISSGIRRDGVWEPVETSALLEVLPRGGVFLDLGANIGYYTVLAALACGEGGRVHAFEPEPANFELLERNVRHNRVGNVECVRAAAGRASGTSELFLSDTNQGDHRLYASEGREGGIPVRQVAIDEHFAGRDPRIDVVKIDTQGSEVAILEGMRGLLEANRGRMSLVVEFWPFGLAGAGDTPQRMAELLAPYGLRVRKIEEHAGGVSETSWERLFEEARTTYHPDGQAFTNLLLTPR